MNPVTLPNGASEATEPEAIPAAAPYSASEATASTDSNSVLQPNPEGTPTSLHEADYSRDTEKVPTSTVPVANGNGSSTSSNLEKKIDLEAGRHIEDLDQKQPGTDGIEVDPNIVDWDGPDDPNNPINWSGKLKGANIAVIASITFLTQVVFQASSPKHKMLIYSGQLQPLGFFHPRTRSP